MSGSTRKHPDAIGYLDDLVAEIGQPWFSFLRDTAVIKNVSVLEPEMLEKVCAALLGKTDEISSVTLPAPGVRVSPSISTSDYLEQLSSFSNFKLLSGTLKIKFNKQISLIFGANGSGKSSLCESFKVLSNPDAPKRPIKNLRTPSSLTSSFSYKFKSNNIATVWTPACGYGVHSEKIKYFDSAIASHNVSVAVEPGRVISLTPFRLWVFESVRDLTSQVRDALRQKQSTNNEQLIQLLTELNADFQEFDSSPLKSVNLGTSDLLNLLSGEITKAKSYSQQEKLTSLLETKKDLEKATSDEGLKALMLEHLELDSITSDLKAIVDNARCVWDINPVEKVEKRKLKKSEQKTLAEALIPEGSTLEKLLALVKSASAMCELDQADGVLCPLCRRTLEEKQIKLFKQYHEMVTDQLEADINALDSEIKKAEEQIKKVQSISVSSWDDLTTLNREMLISVKNNIKTITDACSLSIEPSTEARNSLSTVSEYICTNNELLASKQKAIETSNNGRDAVLDNLKTLKEQIKPLAYQDSLLKKIDKLQMTQQMIIKAKSFHESLLGFTSLLAKITNASKTAYENLVISDFERRLNQEYINLTEKDMNSFGVTLKRSGSDASVTVKPQIGGKGIDDVLSEGEQRMHSLALFFAELESSCCPVLVFDDPISSFDYNYIENYCIRIRDFALGHPICQIIVLTHNWEFFVQLQNKLNLGGLNSELSVQVLESCCAVAEYSEKVDELKQDINTILSVPNEPTQSEKEEMAGKMRRLIETVVNINVFNGQRHQYKQKNQPVSVFKAYTKVKPLTQAEATELGDLFSKLSVTEHDDPRTAYVNTDKAIFKHRYDRIVAIETAIASRK